MSDKFEADIVLAFYGTLDIIKEIRKFIWDGVREFEYAEMDSPAGFGVIFYEANLSSDPPKAINIMVNNLERMEFRNSLSEVSIQIRMNDSDGFLILPELLGRVANLGIIFSVVGLK